MLFRKKGDYQGPVVFVDGAHYPVGKNGHPKMRQRLLWNAGREVYEWAARNAPTHLHLYHERDLELRIDE